MNWPVRTTLLALFVAGILATATASVAAASGATDRGPVAIGDNDSNETDPGFEFEVGTDVAGNGTRPDASTGWTDVHESNRTELDRIDESGPNLTRANLSTLEGTGNWSSTDSGAIPGANQTIAPDDESDDNETDSSDDATDAGDGATDAIDDGTGVGDEETDAENTTGIVENSTETVENTTETVENTTETVENTTGTVENTTETVENTTETVENSTETVENTTEPVENTTEIVENTTEAVENPTDGNGSVGISDDGTGSVEVSVDGTVDEEWNETTVGDVDRDEESIDANRSNGSPGSTTMREDREGTAASTGSGDVEPTGSDDVEPTGSDDVESTGSSDVASAGSGDAESEASDADGRAALPTPFRDGIDRRETATGAAAVGVGALLAGALVRRTWAASAAGAPASGSVFLSTVVDAVRAGELADLPRWLGIAGYSRYDDTDPLEHERRARIHDCLSASPGIHLSGIAEETGIPLPSVRYHLKILLDEREIQTEVIRGKRRYFPVGEDAGALAAALEDDATAVLLEALVDLEPASVSALANRVDRDPSTVTHHLQRLDEDGVVERERDGRAVRTRLSAEARATLAEPATTAGESGRPAPADD